MSQEKLLQYIHHNRRSNTLLVQHNNKQIDKLRTDNSALVQENTRKIDKLRAENTLLIQENTNRIDKLKTDSKLLVQDNNKQIDQLRTEVDSIKAETSPLRQLITENSYLIDMLRFLKQGEWDVDDIYPIYGIGSCTQPCFIIIQR